jgi:hypothetical protein
MSRTLSGNNRAIMGLRTAVLVGLAGSAITAALLVSTDPTGPVDSTAGHSQQVTAPSPVPIPDAARHTHSDSAVMLPRGDVLAYVALSDAWARKPVIRQEHLCAAWSDVDRLSVNQMLSRVGLGPASPAMPAGLVIQFFGDVCND